MIEILPKKGLQKGQYLSLSFFENQISKNLSNISTRIRDIIDYQSRRKGHKKTILSEEEYLSQLYQSYSMDYQHSYGRRESEIIEDDSLKIIDQKFISDYPLFFQPKWKIWYEGEPTLTQLAMINRLAYGYFYKKSSEGQIVCVLKETKKKGVYRLQKEIEIEFGVAKIFDQKNSEFVYINFIQYNPDGPNTDLQAQDPRKFYRIQELDVINYGASRKKDEIKFMSSARLKQRSLVSLEAYHPFIYKKYHPQSKQIEEYFFRLETFYWYLNKEKQVPIRINPLNTKQKHQVKNFMKGNVMDFSNSAKLVPFLTKIPGFQFQLSEQQKELIQTKGNVIVIGRSGTGKTTCAMLRIFSLETLYKVKTIGVQEFKSTDIDMPSKMKNVFLTLSSHLIKQIKTKYSKHEGNVKFQIQEKQKKHRCHIEEKQDDFEINEQKIIINKNLGHSVTCLKNLTQYDFPGFFTIKDFLIMIDGVYQQSYFSRDKNGNLKKIQMDQNIYFFQKQVFWRNQSKVNEFKYEDFRDIFWDTQIKNNKQFAGNLNPHIVWTQIFSQIKGSIQSHKYPKFHISEEKYVNQTKNKFLTIAQKRIVYMIFKIYQRWNGKYSKFDQMDLVNFLLDKFKTQRYFGPAINHLFIDEVQDLTPATIYLLSQIASNNLFYSGDTAQSITKGVSFKFSDIRLMFRQDSVVRVNDQNEPVMKQLTINFRSHNQILKLANSLVKILELLFPKTIDKLRKQTSSRQGPKPIIVGNEQQIKQILNIGSCQQFKMNGKQVVIVRTCKQKQQLKKIFGNGLFFTIQQSKGLQFDDVVIWKMIQNSKYQKLWKIIDCLQIYQNYCNEKAFVDYFLEQGCQMDEIDNKLGLSKKINQFNINLYTEICSQLKLLYTAVTRTKDVLIFYHSLPKQLEKLFRRLELVADYSQETFMEIVERKYAKKKKQLSSDKGKQNYYNQHWKKLGKKFYAQENYEHALVCFQNINDKNMCLEIEAKIKVKEGEKLLEILNVRYQNHKEYGYERQLEIKRIKSMFEEAAVMFKQVNLFSEAGKAYYLGQKYRQAINFFSKMNMFLQIAICYFKLNQFVRAAEMYEKSKKYAKVIQCLKKANRLKAALVKLIQYKKQIQNYEKEREVIKRQILNSISMNICDMKRRQLNIQRQNNQKIQVKAFYQSENIQSMSISQAEKQIRKELFKKQNNMKTEKIQANNITQTIIDDIRLVLILDKSINKTIDLELFFRKPSNIPEIIKQLSIYDDFKLCFEICANLQFYYHVSDYFVVSLWADYSNRIRVVQFYKREWKRKWSLLKKRRQEKISQRANQELSRFIVKVLEQIKNHQNSHLINNLVQNLILCGFYQICVVFFQNYRQFQRFFIKIQEPFTKICKTKGNYKDLKMYHQVERLSIQQQIFCFQYIFHMYQAKISNRILQRYGQKYIQLQQKQENQVKNEARQKQNQLEDRVEGQKFKILIKVIYWQTLRQKLQKSIQNQQDMKKQEEQLIVDKESAIKAIKKFIYDQKQINQKLLKNMQDLSQKQKQRIYSSVKINLFYIHQKNRQLDLAESNLEQIEEKYQMIVYQLQGLKNKMKNIDKQIGKCAKNMQFVQTKIQKYDIGEKFYRQLLKKKLKQKICKQTKNLFKQIELPHQSSSYMKQFYQFQFSQLGKRHIAKILQFQQQDVASSLFICDICIFAISLVLKHDRAVKALDLVSGIQNVLRLIKKNKNFHEQISEHQSQNQLYVSFQYETFRKIKSLLSQIQQFYLKIIRILLHPEINMYFHKILIGFFSCRSFQDSGIKLGFLADYSILNTQSAIIYDLLDEENCKDLEFFDQNYEFLIGEKKCLNQILISFFTKNYEKVFLKKLNLSNQQFERFKQQYTKNQQKIRKQRKEEERKLTQQQKLIRKKQQEVNKQLKRLKDEIYFANKSQSGLLTNLISLNKLKKQKIRLQSKERQIQKNNFSKRKYWDQNYGKKNKQTEKERNQCVICYQPFTDLVLQCKHKFHLDCILIYVQKNKLHRCPQCQMDFYAKNQEKLFLNYLNCQKCNKNMVYFNLKSYLDQKGQQQDLFCQLCKDQARCRKIMKLKIYEEDK